MAAGDVNISYYNGAYVEPIEGFSQTAGTFTLSPVGVPEPATLAVFGAGLLGLAAMRRRTARALRVAHR